MENVSHYGDILAIPFFALLIFYLYKKERKSQIEYVLYFFSVGGFVLDIAFTYLFLVNISVEPAFFEIKKTSA